jgi:glycerol transport system ATP-binding protein
LLAPANAPGAVPAIVLQAQDIGTYWLVTARVGQGADETVLRARLSSDATVPSAGASVWLSLIGERTCYYKDEELVA